MVEEGLMSDERPVRLEVRGEAGELRAEIATPLAVVLTELLQNAVQHGYPTSDGDGAAADAADGVDRLEQGEKRPPGRVVVSFANDGSDLVVRVAFRIRRRSSSDVAPHTPDSWLVARANSRHSSLASHNRHTILAASIWSSAGPVVPIGKNRSGSVSRHEAL
jgi:hypothetical protein